MRSTPSSYGSVAISIHWISAILIFALMGSGFRAAASAGNAARETFLTIHIPLGVALLLLTLARILWRLFADRKPDPVAGGAAWRAFAGKAVHLLFYVVMIAMAASGIGMMALSGAGPVIFGGADAPLPNFHDFAPRIPHGVGARMMIALLVLHIGAALYHQFIKRDSLIARMWYRAR